MAQVLRQVAAEVHRAEEAEVAGVAQNPAAEAHPWEVVEAVEVAASSSRLSEDYPSTIFH